MEERSDSIPEKRHSYPGYADFSIDPDFRAFDNEALRSIMPDLADLQQVFAVMNGVPPCQKEIRGVDTGTVYNWIRQSEASSASILSRWTFTGGRKERVLSRFYLFASRRMLLCGEEDTLLIIYHPETPPEQIGRISDLVREHFGRTEKSNCLFLLDSLLLNMNHRILYLNENPVDLGLMYNDDLAAADVKIANALNSDRNEGYIILTGEPGNGKSSYLKHLTRIRRRRFLYMSKWTSAWFDMYHFDWIRETYSNSVLILENIDELLKDDSKKKGSMTRLLQDIAKGKLRTGFFMPVIITIDQPAASFPQLTDLKSEHLIAHYEFRPLAENKAKTLANSLGKRIEINGPVTLNEIFQSE